MSSSFTMRTGEPMRRAARRFARAQLSRAADIVRDARQPLLDRVHEVRTSIKKVRAVIALTRPTRGGAARRAALRSEKRLRQLSASVSELRDAQVMSRTFEALLADVGADSLAKTALTSARNELARRLRGSERSFENARRAQATTVQLLRERHRTRRWVPGRGTGWGTSGRAPARAFGKSYRRARRAMRRADDEGTGEAFHDWRKTVKALRYQVQYLLAPGSGALREKLRDLDRLGELLGHEHDLTAVEEILDTGALRLSRRSDRALLLRIIDERRRSLRAEARKIGAALFSERARVVRRNLRQEWRGRARAGRPHTATTTTTTIRAAVGTAPKPAERPQSISNGRDARRFTMV